MFGVEGVKACIRYAFRRHGFITYSEFIFLIVISMGCPSLGMDGKLYGRVFLCDMYIAVEPTVGYWMLQRNCYLRKLCRLLEKLSLVGADTAEGSIW